MLIPQPLQGDVSRAVLSSREGQRRYRECVTQVYASVFDTDRIVARLEQIASGVSSALAETDAQAARSFQRRANSLKLKILRRGEELRQQLGVPLDTVEFVGNGVLPLGEWKETMVIAGDPVLRQQQDPSGKTLLVINAGTAASSSSWRKRVVLAAGDYLFEGKLRLMGITVAEGDARSGAGLRISGDMPRKLSGTSDWQDFKYPFKVDGNGASVELVCELKATAGEVWFDAGSLRLVRRR
jgi:hypothetical protein